MGSATPVGFIGLGTMGLPMLINLARHRGLSIKALDPSEAPFVELGKLQAWGQNIRRATAISDLGDCGYVITMLPDSAVTNRMILGDKGDGLVDHLHPGAMVIDMGSSDPAETLRLVPLLAARGLSLVDAPVSGAAAKARTADLSIMVGGDEAMVDRLRPILSQMGRQLIAAGRPGAAHAMKALNNYVYATGLLAVAETLQIVEALGLDGEIFCDVLNASSGRNLASETKLRQYLLPRDYTAGFALRLQAKDLRLADGLRVLTRAHAPQLALCNAIWADALAALPAEADNTAILHHLQNTASTKG